ncbi:hypothetical protein PYW08_002615 [Mythimna loreyi]|uniref:Uncharacterized protein n=1 Tax=Mythimna loreyi TaxID=667449 RepID=A0ACC2QIE9_9NEOP|nr:hypothetical protein PYW08_002615 [Mythimna loreyi]
MYILLKSVEELFEQGREKLSYMPADDAAPAAAGGAVTAAEEKKTKNEESESEDEDTGFGLFDKMHFAVGGAGQYRGGIDNTSRFSVSSLDSGTHPLQNCIYVIITAWVIPSHFGKPRVEFTINGPARPYL